MAELIENSMMVDHIKGRVEVNVYNPSLRPLSNALCSVSDTHKRYRRVLRLAQTLPIMKLGGWKHTTAFHNFFETNRHQTPKHDTNWYYGNREHQYNTARGVTILIIPEPKEYNKISK